MTAPASGGSAADKLREVMARQLELSMTRTYWKPLPHQVPPSGDWMGWLMLAGRGAGKTDACAHYMVEHVKGPPCIPGQVPHWMAIIAPTLGDAATACFSGPSGIRAHDANATMSSKVGGLLVMWPNGSQAKMYGARDPDDVERLRAGGNVCVVAGTMIHTEHGEVPIERVHVNDRVHTRRGLRRVLRSGMTRPAAHVWKLVTSLGTLTATGDHEVAIVGGTTQIQFLKPGDTILAWPTALSTTEYTLEPDKRRGLGVTTSMDVVRSAEHLCDRAACACDVHAEPIDVVMSCFDVTECDHARERRAHASSVITSSKLKSGQQRRRALRAAAVSTLREYDDHVDSHTRNGCGACARSVELGLSEPPSIHEVSPVHARVLHVYATNDVQPVYDLLVEHDHEFVANGLIVMNCLVWMEELAAWRYLQAAYDQMRFGLRLGKTPRWIASTTPKPRPLIKKLSKGEVRRVAITHATMYDNPFLPEHVKEALEEAYTGTTIGSQELYGRLVEQDTNALWTRDAIERNRLAIAPPLRMIEVGVDPSGGAGEQGILVVGRADVTDENSRVLKHGYVLHDATVHMKPEGWARTAVNTAIDWEADRIVVETNFGGDQAVALIVNACEQIGVSIPVRTVHASRGKRPRAEPVSALSVQDRWHHVGRFDELEDQMATWTVDAGWSPDRIDAMVWPAWSMKIVSTIFRSVGSFGGSQMVHKTLGRRRT